MAITKQTLLDTLKEEYEELCDICRNIYSNNSMVHSIYIIIIITLLLICILLVKKLLKV